MLEARIARRGRLDSLVSRATVENRLARQVYSAAVAGPLQKELFAACRYALETLHHSINYVLTVDEVAEFHKKNPLVAGSQEELRINCSQ